MRNVIVTGGSRGLGLGIAICLRDAGFRVIAIARHHADALTVAAKAGAGALEFCSFDLSDLDEIPNLVKHVRNQYGAIYGLVNNAGIGTNGLLSMTSDKQVQTLIGLNVTSPLLLTKHVSRAMMSDGEGGRIVNIASVVAFTGFKGLAAYAASKAALLGFTRSLARELGPLGITVNAVAPGFLDTDMTNGLGGQHREQIVRRSALKRLAEVEDIASGVAFLMSDRSKSITGTVLTVDAGGSA